MKISSATKVDRYVVIIDKGYVCFVDVAGDLVIGFDVPQILHDPGSVIVTKENMNDEYIKELLEQYEEDIVVKGKYTLEELQDAILEAVVKSGHLLDPNQECMKRVKGKVYPHDPLKKAKDETKELEKMLAVAPKKASPELSKMGGYLATEFNVPLPAIERRLNKAYKLGFGAGWDKGFAEGRIFQCKLDNGSEAETIIKENKDEK